MYYELTNNDLQKVVSRYFPVEEGFHDSHSERINDWLVGLHKQVNAFKAMAQYGYMEWRELFSTIEDSLLGQAFIRACWDRIPSGEFDGEYWHSRENIMDDEGIRLPSNNEILGIYANLLVHDAIESGMSVKRKGKLFRESRVLRDLIAGNIPEEVTYTVR